LVIVCCLGSSVSRASTKDTVYAYILKYEIKHPEIVLKQAILETGWFTSKHLMSRNNLFGFRSTKKYKHFKSIEACVEYYKKWQDDRYTNPEENYYHFLQRIRFSRSPEYIATLKRISLKRNEGAPQPVKKTTTTKKKVETKKTEVKTETKKPAQK